MHRAEREFAFVVGGVCALFGGLWIYRGRFGGVSKVVFAAGLLLLLLGVLRPVWLRMPRRLWMRLAELLGGVMTVVILAFVYFCVVAPIGLVKRASGWDPLGRRASGSTSYWRPYSPRVAAPRHFEKMF